MATITDANSALLVLHASTLRFTVETNNLLPMPSFPLALQGVAAVGLQYLRLTGMISNGLNGLHTIAPYDTVLHAITYIVAGHTKPHTADGLRRTIPAGNFADMILYLQPHLESVLQSITRHIYSTRSMSSSVTYRWASDTKNNRPTAGVATLELPPLLPEYWKSAENHRRLLRDVATLPDLFPTPSRKGPTDHCAIAKRTRPRPPPRSKAMDALDEHILLIVATKNLLSFRQSHVVYTTGHSSCAWV